jgi:polyhydroxyalkanoate synthesis regulator phasin
MLDRLSHYCLRGEEIMNRCLFLAVLVGLLLGAPPAVLLAAENEPAAEQDSLSALIDILVEKGVLSAEEQEALRQRIAEAEKPAPPPAPEKPEYPTVNTKVRLETRFSSVQEDENQPYFGNRDDRAGGDGFAVRRARFYLMGQLNPETGYKVQYQSDWGHTNPNLHVAQMEWRGWDFADLILGQLQTPFGYEIVMSDAYLLCTDRAAVSTLLPADKDIGIMLRGKRPLPGGIGYELFVGNGSGKYLANPSHDYLWITRLTAQPDPGLSLGTSFSTNRNTDFSPYQARFLKKNGDPYGLLSAYTAADADETAWEADFQWQRGPTALWGEYIRSKIEPGDGPTVTADGYYLDLHHLLPYRGSRDKLELVLGYQQFDANRAVSDKYDLTAYTLGFNYHLRGSRYGKHRCQEMLRINYVWNCEAEDEVDNDKFIVQYQTWF